MASPVRNILAGSAFAVLLAVLMAAPTIAGISSWKVVLAAVGALLFFLSGYGRGTETK
jgi:hypothetical protein